MKFLLQKTKEFIIWLFGLFRKTKGVTVYEVLAITPGRMHAWVESSVGRIRKPLGSITGPILNKFLNT